MKDLWLSLMENIKEATEILKCHGGSYKFLDEDNMPYVLLADNDGSIYDLLVTEVRLADNDIIEMYVPNYDDWLNINNCLCTSGNNICMILSEEANS